jgi:hypothetical protein
MCIEMVESMKFAWFKKVSPKVVNPVVPTGYKGKEFFLSLQT